MVTNGVQIDPHPAPPNPRASLDAAMSFDLHIGRHWGRASEPGRSAALLREGF